VCVTVSCAVSCETESEREIYFPICDNTRDRERETRAAGRGGRERERTRARAAGRKKTVRIRYSYRTNNTLNDVACGAVLEGIS